MYILLCLLENVWIFMAIFFIIQYWNTIATLSIDKKIPIIIIFIIAAPIFAVEKALENVIDFIIYDEEEK